MVNLSKALRKRRAVNLLPKDSFDESVLGKIMGWALTFGKWTVVATQLVVIGAFLMRFGLDRKLTNLRRDIQAQVVIIKSYEQIERDFLIIQKRVAFASELMDQQDITIEVIEAISRVTPSEIWFEKLSISNGSVTATANSTSIAGFSKFLEAIKRDGFFKKINVGSIESGILTGAQLKFDVSLEFEGKAL